MGLLAIGRSKDSAAESRHKYERSQFKRLRGWDFPIG